MPAGALNLLFKIDADDQGADAEFKRLMQDTSALDAEIRKLASSLGVLPSEITAVVASLSQMANEGERNREIMPTFGAAGLEAIPALEQIAQKTAQVTAEQQRLGPVLEKSAVSFQQMGNQVQAMAGQFAAMGGAPTQALVRLGTALGQIGPYGLAAGAALTALAGTLGVLGSLAGNVLELANHMRSLSLETGLTAQELLGVQNAAAATGTSIDTFTQALLRMERGAEAGGKAAEALAHFGVTAEALKRDPKAALETFLDTFNRMGPSAERNALLLQAFGRGTGQLIPLLEQLEGGFGKAADHARNLGETLDNETIVQAHRVNELIADIHTSLEGLEIQALKPLIQDITVIKDLMPELGKGINAVSFYIQAQLHLFIPWLTAVENFLRILEFIKGQKIGFDRAIPEEPSILTVGGQPIIEGAAAWKLYGEEREKAHKKAQKAQEDMTEAELLANRAERELADQRRAQDQEIERSDSALSEAEERYALLFRNRQIESSQYVAVATSNINRAYETRLKAQKDLQDFEDRAYEAEKKRINDSKLLANQKEDALEALEEKRKVQLDKRYEEEIKANKDLEKNFKDVSKTILDETDKIIKDTEKVVEETKKWGEAAAKVFTEDLAKQRIKPEEVLPEEAGKPILTLEDQIIAKIHEQALAVSNLEAAWINVRNAVKGVIDDWAEATKKELGLEEATKATEVFGATAGKMGALLVKAFNDMAKALGAVLQQWVLTGKTGPAVMRTILAATLATIAEQAAVEAIKATALGFYLLATQQYAQAGQAFISAGLWASLAVGSALVGRAVAPATEGGAAGAAGTTGPPPSTTINIGGAPALGLSPDQAFGVAVAGHTQAVNAQTHAINNLNDKLAAMSPGDVVTRAAQTTPTAFASGVQSAVRSDSTFARSLGLSLLPSS